MCPKTPLNDIVSGASFGAFARDEHARIAVQAALEKSQIQSIGGILLFLTTGYALDPRKAIKEAVKASGSVNVSGCCSLGVFNEESSSREMEGAVAMAFPQGSAFSPLIDSNHNPDIDTLFLSLCSPNAAAIAVHALCNRQFGAITSDEIGEGPYSVWQAGKIVEREYSHTVLPDNLHYHLLKCESVRPLSSVMQINKSHQHQLIELDQQPALDSLNQFLSEHSDAIVANSTLNLVAMVSETSNPESITNGHHQLLHVVNVDEPAKRLDLSAPIKAGQRLVWAVRDQRYAERQIRQQLEKTKQELHRKPKFAIMFRNVNRGTHFYQRQDHELRIFKEIFPTTAMIGLLSQAELLPGYRAKTTVHHSSTVFGFFY